jgi:hypothetical protein
MPHLPTSLDFPPALNVPTRLDAAGTGSLPRLNLCLPLSLPVRLERFAARSLLRLSLFAA